MLSTTLLVCLLIILVSIISVVLSSTPTVHSREQQLEDKIDSLLPQTQCGKCDFTGCRPYARAIVRGEVSIDRCPPGGIETVQRLEDLLGRDNGLTNYVSTTMDRGIVATIDEQVCIGCVKCINACPVDAIVGAAKQMHTIIDSICTGCELCVAPCPVDCIEMVPERVEIKKWVWSKPLRPGEGTA